MITSIVDTIQMKSNYAWNNCNHDNIAIRSHIKYIIVWKFWFLLPNVVAFFSQKGKTFWFFDFHLLTCSVRKMVLMCLLQNVDMCLLYQSHQIARLLSHLIQYFSKRMFTVEQENAAKFGTKNEMLQIILYYWMTFYGYIVVDSCIIIFNLSCIMQFK